MQPTPWPLHAARAALLPLGLAGCDLPQGPAFEPSPATLAAPPPQLVPTGQFREVLADAPSEQARLETDAAALAARAEALRARARALDAPVLVPGDRDRLESPAGDVPENGSD
jgi:hypothetical protein